MATVRRKTGGHRARDWRAISAVVAFLLVAALSGGASSAEAPQVLLVRLAALLTLAAAALWMPAALWRKPAAPLLLMAALVLMIAVQLIPLPPALWTSLPGRVLIAQVATKVGFTQPWRPISIAPMATWNSLIASIVPLAVLVGLVWLGPRRQILVLVALLALGLCSAMLALLQLVDASGGRFYLYGAADFGSATGFFINRNHQAVLLVCLFPMLAALGAVSDTMRPALGRLSMIAALIVSFALIPLLLVTGSRAGLLLLPFGIVLALGVGWNVVSRLLRIRMAWIVAVGALLVGGGLTALFVYFDRAQSLARLFATDVQAEQRVGIVAPIWKMAMSYFPIGSGFGTFPVAYRIVEPDDQLNRTWLNHAHNDFLEIIGDAGLPAVCLLIAALFWWGYRVIALFRLTTGREGVVLGRAGAAISLLLMLASLSDYPLRTPLLAIVFAVSISWMAPPRGADSSYSSASN